MPCPTCHCDDWTPVLPPPDQRLRSPSLGARIGGAVRALFGGGTRDDKRQCLRCGSVYAVGRDRDAEDEEEDRIAQRLSRIESQMSGFNHSVMPPAGGSSSGLKMVPKNGIRCARCGHYAIIEHLSADTTCPGCGRLYDKVEQALKDQAPTHKSVSL